MATQTQTQNAPTQNAAVSASKQLIEYLDAAQRAALEQKFNALAPEIRVTVAKAYPNVKTAAERYILRQIIREANGKLASVKRPGWYALLLQWGPVLNHSLNGDSREIAVSELRKIGEQFDAKEATNLLKKFKNAQDVTSSTPYIVELCGIFGVDAANLK